MKRLITFLLLILAWPVAAQLPGGSEIQIDRTPVVGGTAAQCLYITSTLKVGKQVCGTGTASDITVGTTTVTGAASGDILTRGAAALGKLTPGTGVNTALAVNVGSAGAFVVQNGALGTPSSGVGTNLTALTAANISAGALANGMTATTQAASNNSTSLATTAYVDVNHARILGASSAPVSHTGNTNETILATIPVPAGLMGLNGTIRIDTLWSFSGGNGTRQPIVRFGAAGAGTGGTAYGQGSQASTVVQMHTMYIIGNKNSASVQKGGLTAGVLTANATALASSAVNTANASEIVLTMTLANGADTGTLESYIIEFIPGV